MKKFVTAVIAFALALSVVAPVAASAQTTASYTFNTNLTVGARGADVVALQSFLESKGLLTIPAGTAKGYFGGLTKSAVAAYQSMKGITPAAGYFGPITRAAVNAEGSTPTTPATPGCPAGAMYNSMTGMPCSTTSTPTTPGLSNVEGTVELKAAPTPANNSNITSQNDIPVLGIEARAKLAPVQIATVDLQVSSLIGGTTAENPASFINTIKVWDGSTVLATVPVTSTTFSKDSSGTYYVRIPGLNFVVAQDMTKTLTFSFSVNGSIDTDRTVNVGVYGTNGIRTVTGNGVNTFYGSTQVSATARQHVFKKPGDSTLTIQTAPTQVRSSNNRVGTSGITGVSVLTFGAKAETGDAVVTAVYASTTYSGTAPTVAYLYDGSSIIGSASVSSSGGTISFTDLRVNVTKDTTKFLTVKVDMPSNTSSGSYSSTSVAKIVYDKPNGTTANAVNTQVIGNNMYFYPAVARFALVGTPTLTQVTDTNGKTTSVTAVFTLDVMADGGTVVAPVAGDFDVRFSSSTGNKAADAVSVTTNLSTGQNIGDGGTARVTVTATLNGSTAASTSTTALYTAYIYSIDWVAGSTTVTNQTTGGVEDLKAAGSVSVAR